MIHVKIITTLHKYIKAYIHIFNKLNNFKLWDWSIFLFFFFTAWPFVGYLMLKLILDCLIFLQVNIALIVFWQQQWFLLFNPYLRGKMDSYLSQGFLHVNEPDWNSNFLFRATIHNQTVRNKSLHCVTNDYFKNCLNWYSS